MSAHRLVFHGKTKQRIFLNPELINPHLTCSVCLDIFEQPHRLLCGHTFCYICIQNCVRALHKQICPQCKTDFSKRKLEKDLIANKMVDDLDVKCSNNRCNFIGKHSVLTKHKRICEHKERKEVKINENKDDIVIINQEQDEQVRQAKSQKRKISKIIMNCDESSDSQSDVL